MHFILTYDIHSTGNEREKIEKQISQVIHNYSWVKPLTTTFVIQTFSQNDWDNILKSLNSVYNSNPNKLNFLLTPLMSGGKYNGILSNELWEEINKRTN